MTVSITFTITVDDEDADLLFNRKVPVRPESRLYHKIAERFLGKTPKGYVIDHINRDALDNTRKNLRHITTIENARNTDRRIKSPYRNVRALGNSFQVQIQGFKPLVFSDAVDAAHYADNCMRELGYEVTLLNFPLEFVSPEPNSYGTPFVRETRFGRGVSKAKTGFYARIVHNKERVQLGRYATAKEAGYAYDNAARRLYGDKAVLNYPNSYITPVRLDTVFRGRKQRGGSGYYGVTKYGNKFYAYITADHKRVSLGGRSTAIEAAKLHDMAYYKLHGIGPRLNFPEDYGL